MILNIVLILIGLIIILLKEKIVDYIESVSLEKEKHINRKILMARIFVVSSFAIIIGISRLIFLP